MKAARALLILFLTALPAMGWAAGETASKDGSRIPAMLLHNPTTFATDRWESDGSGAAKVSISGALGAVSQGASGSDTDPWNMMIRDGTGTELGLAASPFAISIFDAASNLLGVTANPFVVDLGINNDVTVTSGSITVDNASGASAVNIQDGGNVISIDDGGGSLTIDSTTLATEATLATIDADTGNIATSTASIDADTSTIASDTTSIDGKTPSLGQAVSASSVPVVIASDQSNVPVTGTVTANAGTGTFNMQATAALPGSVRLSDGTAFYKATTPSDTQPISAVALPLPSGASTEAKQDTNITNTTAIELNTDSPTVFGSTTVTVTSTATLILAADPNRRTALVRNADSNTILFTGPTSGVTTSNGMPIAVSGVPGATGNGGTIIYTHTAAIWGIAPGGQSVDVRVQTESD